MKRLTVRFAVMSLLVWGCVSAASAGSIEDVKSAMQSKDYIAALQIAKPLAENGDDTAQNLLFGLYSGDFKGIPRDDVEAAKWLVVLAEKGQADTQFYLGVWYLKGRGVGQDYARAADWFRKAALQRGLYQGTAQVMLGILYRDGTGVPQDYVLAYYWSDLAAPNDIASDLAAKARDQIATKMTTEQIAEAQRLAGAWKQR